MNILKVTFSIIGALIGAGFASGQEIYVFFFSYGTKGIIGMIISSFIIGLVIYKALNIIDKIKVENYKEMVQYFIKNKKMQEIINAIVNILILISFYVMIAGFGAYLNQEYGINSIIGSGILSIICYIVLKTNVKGIVKLNEILIPLLISTVAIIGIVIIKYIDFNNVIFNLQEQNTGNWLISSILYASYNCILLIPVLITIREYISNNKNIKYISITIGMIIFTLLIIIYLSLTNVNIDIKMLQMPAVYAIKEIFPSMKNIYGIIILISIFTTAISLEISLIKNTTKSEKSSNILSIFLCISAVVCSKFGFSNLVNNMYPILGILGILQIYIILFSKDKTEKKN